MRVHYTDGSSQRLKREEDNDRNHDKKAMAADSWYLVHSFEVQNPSDASRRLVTLAVEQDAANDRNDSTYTNVAINVPCRCNGVQIYELQVSDNNS